MIERDADVKDGSSEVTEHRTSRTVVAVTRKQALLDAVLIRLVAVDRPAMSRLVPAFRRRMPR